MRKQRVSKRDEKRMIEATGYVLAWFELPNSNFGGTSPLEMIEQGKGYQVAKLVRDTLGSYKLTMKSSD